MYLRHNGTARTILAALVSLLLSVPLLAAQKSSYQLIQEEFAKGQMSTEERLILEVQSIKDQSALPANLQSGVIEISKCATEILLEVRQNWNNLSSSTQSYFREILARPTRSFNYNTPGGNFKIWYNTTGTHAVPTADTAPANGIPDYVEWLAAYADSSYRTEITNMGHLPPPSDGASGGDSRYDIYTEEMGYYGYTQPESGGPNPWNDMTSYISVHRNFSGFPANNDPEGDQKGAAKVTVAHEYYHAVQFAYDASENVWFMEACATWMENYVFDLVDDNYNYNSEWFTVPELSLHSTTGLHLYAAYIWPMYLERNFGWSIMPTIWNELINTTPYPAFSTVLATHGAQLNAEFAKFTAWNFITNSRDDGNHYEEGAFYPLITLTRTHNSYPVSGQLPVGGKLPDAMGANYVVFNVPSGASTLTVDFNGDNTTPWIVTMMPWKSAPSDVYAETLMTLNGVGDGTFTLNNASNWNSLVMVITNVSQTLSDRSYTYGASYSSLPNYAVSVAASADDTLYSNKTTNLTFQVTNTGALSETFNLSATSSLGWTVNPTPSSLNLASTASAPVNVQVVCPFGTLPSVIDQIVLKADGTSIIGITDSDTASVLVLIQHGDADYNGLLTISDAVQLIEYIFAGGDAPEPVLESGDADCNGLVNISDAVFLINYIFSGGPYPPCNPF